MVLFLCSLQHNNYCCILVFLTTAKLQLSFEICKKKCLHFLLHIQDGVTSAKPKLQLSFEICKRKSTFFIFVLQLAAKAT